MSDPITKTELENAATDAATIASVVNGTKDDPNPGHANGTVQNRLGRTVKTIDLIGYEASLWAEYEGGDNIVPVEGNTTGKSAKFWAGSAADSANAAIAAVTDVAPSIVLAKQATPPVSPSVGDAYLIATSATGAWAGHDNNLARYTGSTWLFFTPFIMQRVMVQAVGAMIYNGSAWKQSASFDVFDFGAAGDNSTDDLTAFQTAIDAAHSLGGGTVEVPYTSSGYKLNGALLLKSGVRLQGIGKPQINFTNTADSGSLQVTGSHTSVRGFMLTWVNTNESSSGPVYGGCLLLATNSTVDFECSDCAFNSAATNPDTGTSILMNATGLQNIRFRDITINRGGYGISAYSSTSGTGLLIENLTGNTIGSDCIELNCTLGGLSDVLILGGSIDNSNANRTGGSSGFAVGMANVKRARIIGLRVRATRNEAIHLEQGCEDIYIGHCQIEVTTAVNGIHIVGNDTTPTTGVHVDHCKINGGGVGAIGIAVITGGGSGISTSGHIFTNNHVKGFISFGIQLFFVCSEVANNRIESCAVGIDFGTITASVSVHDNVFVSCTQIYRANLGSVGRTILEGTWPTTFWSSSNSSGILHCHGISGKYAATHNGSGAQNFTLVPAPATAANSNYIGIATLQINKSATYISATGFYQYDGTTWAAQNGYNGTTTLQMLRGHQKGTTVTSGAIAVSSGAIVGQASYTGTAGTVSIDFSLDGVYAVWD